MVIRRWWWRAALATLVFFVLLTPGIWLGEYVWFALMWTAEMVGLLRPAQGSVTLVAGRSFASPPMWLVCLLYPLLMAIMFLPPLVVALLVYHRLALGAFVPDGYTRCGNCGYILKGLTEPRCPECGEHI